LFKTNDLYDLFTLASDGSSGNETGALFAGTDSEVKVMSKSKANKEKSKQRKLSNPSSSTVHHESSSSSVHLLSQSSCDTNDSGISSESRDPNGVGSSRGSCDLNNSSSSCKRGRKVKSLEEIRKAWQVELFGDTSTKTEYNHTSSASHDASRTNHKSRKRKHHQACELTPTASSIREFYLEFHRFLNIF